jgi:hypothetical protein
MSGYASPSVPPGHAPTVAVMKSYTDRELLDALLDLYQEMPDDAYPDFDIEGHDEYTQIAVDRSALREAFRRLAEDDDA